MSLDTIQKMCNRLAHRGPDGQGDWVKAGVGLGHRRLAVIDTSAAGRQPMTLGDRWTLTFNGEIYNHRSLRSELEERGHQFATATDSEVVLVAYREWGAACLDRFRGMFAFAIWDAAESELFIARDRVGKKPFFYYVDEDGFCFASEPQAFFADPAFQPTIDYAAIEQYVSLQYVPSPRSAFREVSKLPPAHFAVVRRTGVSIVRYWSLDYEPKLNVSEHEAADLVHSGLRESVRLRLVSDVPLGAFLSGGIDSAAVVACMAEESAGAVRTFSIGFEESGFNELGFARQVAECFATVHHEFVVRADAVQVLPELIMHHGEPFADPAAVPTYYLSKMTRSHVTVALNGDGGDENFAGYNRYRAAASADRIPRAAAAAIGGALRWLPAGSSIKSVDRARRFGDAIGESGGRRYFRWLTHFSAELKKELYTPEFLDAVQGHEAIALVDRLYERSRAHQNLDKLLDVDVQTYLPDDLLCKVDIASMSHGLEARCPFLDHVFMALCASLPVNLKLEGQVTKTVLKRAFAGLLPQSIVYRRKQGFMVPIASWLRNELRQMTTDLLLSPRSLQRGFFQPAAVRRLVSEHLNGRKNWSNQLWTLLVLELWCQMCIDRRGTPETIGSTS